MSRDLHFHFKKGWVYLAKSRWKCGVLDTKNTVSLFIQNSYNDTESSGRHLTLHFG